MNKTQIYNAILFFAVLCSSCSTLKIDENTDYADLLDNRKSILTKEFLTNCKDKINEIHPDAFKGLSESKFDSLIDDISLTFPKDSIIETKSVHIIRKVLDTLTWVDPHIRIMPIPYPKGKKPLKEKDYLVWPFDIVNIDNKIIVDKSYDSQIKTGDIILKINGISGKDYLDYTYKERYMESTQVQLQYNFCFSPKYNFIIKRNNDVFNATVDGMPYSMIRKCKANTYSKYYEANNAAYIRIDEFDHNKQIIKNIKHLVKGAKEKNIENIIIDVRRNHGGISEDFDKLFSLFINKDSLPYEIWCKYKVSEPTLKSYGYPKDSIGKNVFLTGKNVFHTIKLNKSLYLGDFNYYVLISKDTESTASSFVNVLQYNDAAKLVGENLRHNALSFGEISVGTARYSRIGVSTVEVEEYSKQVDGILRPDIEILYSATEYSKGKDDILEKLLLYITKH